MTYFLLYLFDSGTEFSIPSPAQGTVLWSSGKGSQSSRSSSARQCWNNDTPTQLNPFMWRLMLPDLGG